MKALALVFLFLISLNLQAETIQSFQVLKENSQMHLIAERFEVKERNKTGFLVYVLKERVAEFRKLAPQAKMLSSDINLNLKNKMALAGYHSFEQIKKMAKVLEMTYPKLAKVVPYGTSRKGLPLFAIKLSDNVEVIEDEKKVMLTSATHGDELITTEVLLALTESLLKGYDSNQRFKKILNNTEIYIILVVNPEGFTRRSRYSGGIDPNRQYPWPGHPNRRTPVPAIDSIMKFYKKIDFDGSIDFHASGKMVMFPWGYTRDLIQTADHQVFDRLTADMAKENRYKHGPISRVIYVAKGSSADFYYGHNSGLALGIELTTSKVPRASRIPGVVKEASEMTWKYLEHFSR